ncbi:hypothetical protein IFM89_016259 [Coptis chinensis]|uniref:Uncharacterized protein n=1 Tax=Coptis chinensis TaxID=261450 RepID=A0A835H4Q4_9MAGN|nr:hypothetical protein IFM89_016259 [Coptis chinensis]
MMPMIHATIVHHTSNFTLIHHFPSRYEFKTNHEEWIKTVKPRLGADISDRVLAAVKTTHENIKAFYKVKTEMRAALHSLLKEDGILVIPTIPDFPLKLDSGKRLSSEFQEKAFVLLSIAGMFGCCQPSLQEQVGIASNSLPLPDTNGDMDTSELLKEKGNATFKGKQWNKAVKYCSEAIKLSENATYFCNRAAAYLELGCFQQAEADCSQAIIPDKKNVKAYLRRGTARVMLLCYKEAAQDFKHALVLEPQNKVANLAEKRLRKLAS